jgi:hypothetical protein
MVDESILHKLNMPLTHHHLNLILEIVGAISLKSNRYLINKLEWQRYVNL